MDEEEIERIKKTYLRYFEVNQFGVISSFDCRSIEFIAFEESSFVISGGVQSINIFNSLSSVLLAELIIPYETHSISNDLSNLTCFTLHKPSLTLLVGYESGEIYFYSLQAVLKEVSERITTNPTTINPIATLSGHNKGIVSLTFDLKASLAASGSRDTSIVIWDVTSQRGLFKLNGHTDQVTDVIFLETDKKYLVSGSKDSLVKIWDIEGQYCLQTITEFRSAILSLSLYYNLDKKFRILVNCRDSLVRAIELEDKSFNLIENEINRKTSDYVMNVKTSANGRFIAFQTKAKVVEIYKLRNQTELKSKLKKAKTEVKSWKHELEFFGILRTKSSIKSIAFGNFTQSYFNIYLGLKSNLIECHQVHFELKLSKKRKMRDSHSRLKFVSTTKVKDIGVNGHRSEVRCCALSSEKSLLLLAADTQGSIKLWNVLKGTVLSMTTLKGTKEERYILCCDFAPGSNYFLVATKYGYIHIFATDSMNLVSSVKAHEEGTPVHTFDINCNCQEVVTGGGDKTVKFWSFDLNEEENTLNLRQTRVLKLNEEVICVKLSKTLNSSEQLLCVSTTDHTVKVFDNQSLKFKLSLYGHKLPVTCLDISDDNTLVVTGSLDKNLKIWGLDFGDCHKSIFAHDLRLNSIKFIPKTHQFITISDDKTLKYWDADNFNHVTTYNSFSKEIISLDILTDKYNLSSNLTEYIPGSLFVAITGARRVKLFKRSNDIIFPNEERDRLLLMSSNQQQQNDFVNTNYLSNLYDSTLNTNNIPGLKLLSENQAKLINSSSVNIDVLKNEKILSHNEKLSQALLFFKEENETNQVLSIYKLTKAQYLFKVLNEISFDELPRVLLFLSYTESLFLIETLHRVVIGSTAIERHLEKVMNILLLVVEYNFKQIQNNKDNDLKIVIKELVDEVRERLSRYKKIVNKNMYAIKLIHSFRKQNEFV